MQRLIVDSLGALTSPQDQTPVLPWCGWAMPSAAGGPEEDGPDRFASLRSLERRVSVSASC